MKEEMERVDGYLATITRLEPDIHMIDPGAFYASAAISLKRIADINEIHAMGYRSHNSPRVTHMFNVLFWLIAAGFFYVGFGAGGLALFCLAMFLLKR